MTLYNCKAIAPDSYRITKFTPDMDVESSYLTSHEACECPAGTRSICRHRIMLPRFIAHEAIHGEYFFDYEASKWIRASSEAEQGLSSAEVDGDYTEGGAGTSIEGDANYSIASKGAALRSLASIPGVTVLDLSDMGAVHNTIAEAIGEVPLPSSRPRFDRRF